MEHFTREHFKRNFVSLLKKHKKFAVGGDADNYEMLVIRTSYGIGLEIPSSLFRRDFASVVDAVVHGGIFIFLSVKGKSICSVSKNVDYCPKYLSYVEDYEGCVR